MAIRTIFSMAEDCAQGERRGWQEFVRDFAGIARSLLVHYFPTLGPEMDRHVAAVFRRAGAQRESWFRGLKFSNEREFMMAFRDLVFAYGREQDREPAAPISLDRARTAMKDLPLLEREMLWLFIKGYDAPRIAAIMMDAGATADAVKRIADEHLALSASALMESAKQANTDQCCSLKIFNNIVNGQITWREREAAEQHMADCFYCIDRFTTFQEMVRLRKDVSPLHEPEVEAILAQLPFVSDRRRGVFSRLFDRTAH
jgi:hypothetical protein